MNSKMPCYRKDDCAMRPIYRLFHPNFVHAYVHYFARIWFWTNFSRSHSAHWSDMLILNAANNCVAISTQRHVPSINTPRSTSAKLMFTSKFPLIVLDAPSPMKPPRISAYTLYF